MPLSTKMATSIMAKWKSRKRLMNARGRQPMGTDLKVQSLSRKLNRGMCSWNMALASLLRRKIKKAAASNTSGSLIRIYVTVKWANVSSVMVTSMQAAGRKTWWTALFNPHSMVSQGTVCKRSRMGLEDMLDSSRKIRSTVKAFFTWKCRILRELLLRSIRVRSMGIYLMGKSVFVSSKLLGIIHALKS